MYVHSTRVGRERRYGLGLTTNAGTRPRHLDIRTNPDPDAESPPTQRRQRSRRAHDHRKRGYLRPSRAGWLRHVPRRPPVGIDVTGCRPAVEGEAHIDLYASSTPEEDRGDLIASTTTNAAGEATFFLTVTEPYVYFGQGEPGAGGRFSDDIAVDLSTRSSFLILNHVAADGDAAPSLVPTTKSAVIDVRGFICHDPSRVGASSVAIDDPSKPDADSSACRPAAPGELSFDLFESETATSSGAESLVATNPSGAAGQTAFRYALDQPFIAVGIGSAVSLPVSVTGGQRIAFYAVSYVTDATPASGVTIDAQRIECPDARLAGTVRFVQAGSATDPAYASCRPSGIDDARISLYESSTGAEDPGVRVTTVATTAGGYVGFTYTGGQPYVYLGEGEPNNGGSFSADVAVTDGAKLKFLIVAYV